MSEQTWKIEEGDVLWRWDPVERPKLGPIDSYAPGWVRIGRLEDLAALAEKLDLPACTVEQALGCAGSVLRLASEPLRALFPDLDVAVFEENTRIHEIMGRVPPARRALALALRALSDRLLEVS